MREIDLSEIKRLQLDMLVWINDICEKNNLHCCLSGGTLLGAVRHKGFIPWDDDIDVMLPRAEYKKLIGIIKKEHTSRYSLLHTGNSFAYPYSKLVDNHTKIKVPYADVENNDRLWIDIFPVDGLHKSNYFCRIKYLYIYYLQYIFRLSFANLQAMPKSLKQLRLKLMAIPIRFIKTSTWGKLIDIESRKIPFENSKYVGVQCWGYGYKERMPGDEWRNYQKKTFEGKEYYVPGCWDYYLKSLYGDYMKLPPKDKRKTHKITAYLLDENEIKEQRK